MKIPDAKPEAWNDIASFTEWALSEGWTDERIITVCELFLKLKTLFEERDGNSAKH